VRLWRLSKKMRANAIRQEKPSKSKDEDHPEPLMGLPVPAKPLTILQKTEALTLHLHQDIHKAEQYIAQLVASEDISFVFVSLQHHRLAVDRLLEQLRRRYPKLHLPVTVNITDED